MRLFKSKKLSVQPGPHPARREILLKPIDIATQTGLEIGPLCFPLVTKAASNGGVFYVDHATAAESREKYKDDTYVKIDEIVETDYRWGSQSLPELVGGRLFDYVIASHVIEHVPNLLGWLQENAAVLRDGGILALAIPDKRYTFDYKRELTTFGALLHAYLTNKRRPDAADVFDHYASFADVDLVQVWNGKFKPTELVSRHTIEEAWEKAQAAFSSDSYVDVHVSVVTPDSFLSILEKSARLDLLEFEIASFTDTAHNTLEFLVTLRRSVRNCDRNELRERQLRSIEAARALLSR